MEQDHEQELIRRVQAGEHEPFRNLLELHEQVVSLLVMRQVGNRELAHEITHDAFVQSYLNIKKFRGESSFRTWLIRIALNEVHAHYRKKEHIEFSPDKHGGQTEMETGEEKKQEMRLSHFRNAVQQLTPILKDTLVLSSIEGKSYQEVAEILEIPIGTVRSRLNQARIKLREILLEDEVFHELA